MNRLHGAVGILVLTGVFGRPAFKAVAAARLAAQAWLKELGG